MCANATGVHQKRQYLGNQICGIWQLGEYFLQRAHLKKVDAHRCQERPAGVFRVFTVESIEEFRAGFFNKAANPLPRIDFHNSHAAGPVGANRCHRQGASRTAGTVALNERTEIHAVQLVR